MIELSSTAIPLMKLPMVIGNDHYMMVFCCPLRLNTKAHVEDLLADNLACAPLSHILYFPCMVCVQIL